MCCQSLQASKVYCCRVYEGKDSLPLLVQGIRGLGLRKSNMGSARLWGFGYCRPGFSAALRAPQVTLRDRTRFSCYLGGMDVV